MTDLKKYLFEAVKERRSVRKYTDEPVTKEELLEIIDAGRWAPSGLNNQPWKFLVIAKDDPRQEVLAELTKYGHIVRAATALIAVFLDKGNMYHPMKDHQAAGAAIQNMLLATHAMGLGAVWLGEIVNQAPEVMEALSLPAEELEFMALLAVGRPAAKGSSSRKELASFLLEEIE